MHLTAFFQHALNAATRGGGRYHVWMGALTLVMLFGGGAYWIQLRDGLVVTGMSDHVSWGLYISNFTFLVSVAVATMVMVLPAYILKDVDFAQAVLIAQGVAVAAVIMSIAFVVADLGNPLGAWHMTPLLGFLNWPRSLLAWDMVGLNGFLALNLAIPFYILYTLFKGGTPNRRRYVPFIYLTVFWAVGVHMVEVFVLSGLPARPFWSNSLLGPRFLASAFVVGPALMILLLGFIRRETGYPIRDATIGKLAMIATIAAQVNLIILASEIFKEFNIPTHHAVNAQYLFFGLDGHDGLVRWIWTSITMNVAATIILTIHPLRRNPRILMPACIALVVAIWMEKGMGLVIPGFVPSPLGEIVEYSATWVEFGVTAGIWAIGLFVLTVLVRVALPIQTGEARSPYAARGAQESAAAP